MNFAEFNEQTSFDKHSLSNHVWGDQLIKQQHQERKERERDGLEKYKIQLEKEKNEKIKKKKLENEIKEKEYIEINKTNMWEPGKDYPNVFVPLSIKKIPSLDKVNFLELWLDRGGKYNILTTLWGAVDIEPYTIEEYYEEFCTKKEENGEIKYIITKNIENVV